MPDSFMAAMDAIAGNHPDLDYCEECCCWKYEPCDCDRRAELIAQAEEVADRYHIPAWDQHANEMREMILKLIAEVQ